jgi:hypothetical protein
MLRRFLRVRTHKKRRGEQRIQSSDRSPNEPERGKHHPFPDHDSPHRPPVRAGTPRPDPRWLTASRVASLKPGELSGTSTKSPNEGEPAYDARGGERRVHRSNSRKIKQAGEWSARRRGRGDDEKGRGTGETATEMDGDGVGSDTP